MRPVRTPRRRSRPASTRTSRSPCSPELSEPPSRGSSRAAEKSLRLRNRERERHDEGVTAVDAERATLSLDEAARDEQREPAAAFLRRRNGGAGRAERACGEDGGVAFAREA